MTSVEDFARAYLPAGLLEAVSKLQDATLAGWRLESLTAIGGQGILWTASKAGRIGLLKVARLPYHRPVEFGNEEIERARRDLCREADLLRRLSGSLLPERLDFAEAANPLLSDRAPRVRDREPVLVMERIDGRPLDEVRDFRPEWLGELLAFLVRLRAEGLFYTDFRPAHLLVTAERKIRILDAGSIADGDRVPASPGYSDRGASPEARSVQSLGRTVYSALANKVVVEGVPPDFAAVPAAWRSWVESASLGRGINEISWNPQVQSTS